MDVKQLCEALRSFDERKVDCILGEALDERGLGLGVIYDSPVVPDPLETL